MIHTWEVRKVRDDDIFPLTSELNLMDHIYHVLNFNFFNILFFAHFNAINRLSSNFNWIIDDIDNTNIYHKVGNSRVGWSN